MLRNLNQNYFVNFYMMALNENPKNLTIRHINIIFGCGREMIRIFFFMFLFSVIYIIPFFSTSISC